MRISTSQIYDAGSLNIQRNQAALFKLQNQLSTGRRVLTPERAVTFINDFCFEKPVLSNAEVEKLALTLNEQQAKG